MVEMTKVESQNQMNQLVLRTLLALTVRNGGTIVATDEEMSFVDEMGMSIKLTPEGVEIKAVLADELSNEIARAQADGVTQIVTDEETEFEDPRTISLYAKRNNKLN